MLDGTECCRKRRFLCLLGGTWKPIIFLAVSVHVHVAGPGPEVPICMQEALQMVPILRLQHSGVLAYPLLGWEKAVGFQGNVRRFLQKNLGFALVLCGRGGHS